MAKQILRTECTMCGDEHEVENNRAGWRPGDSLDAYCVTCKCETSHWIMQILEMEESAPPAVGNPPAKEKVM